MGTGSGEDSMSHPAVLSDPGFCRGRCLSSHEEVYRVPGQFPVEGLYRQGVESGIVPL